LIDKSLGDGALNLLESLLLIFTSGVWHIHLRLDALDREVVTEGLLRALNSIITPLSEEQSFHGERTDNFFLNNILFVHLLHRNYL